MKAIANTSDTDQGAGRDLSAPSWTRVFRDVLVFQFKLVVDGLKDLGLAQVALGAALIDVLRRDGSPGRRFYGIVGLSDRFDRWLDLHEPLARVPDDAPEYVPGAGHSVDDIIDGIESSARTVAATSANVSDRGIEALRREAARLRTARERAAHGMGRDQAFDRA